MPILALTTDTLQATLESKRFIAIDFWADWCGPCKSFKPVYEQVAERFPELCFASIDVDAEPDLAEAFGVRSVPTLMVIREKILVLRDGGAMSVAELVKRIEQARLIDMDDLRNELAALEGDADAIDH